jgi:DNA-directed RNA polymerase specialized sigma24 family protein
LISSLFKEQASSLVKYLSARFRDGAEAEEVAQEAWLRLYTKVSETRFND